MLHHVVFVGHLRDAGNRRLLRHQARGEGLTEALSIEFRRYGVRAADTLPGLIDTAILPPGAAERAPKEGMFRLIPAMEVAKIVWEAYTRTSCTGTSPKRSVSSTKLPATIRSRSASRSFR